MIKLLQDLLRYKQTHELDAKSEDVQISLDGETRPIHLKSIIAVDDAWITYVSQGLKSHEYVKTSLVRRVSIPQDCGYLHEAPGEPH